MKTLILFLLMLIGCIPSAVSGPPACEDDEYETDEGSCEPRRGPRMACEDDDQCAEGLRCEATVVDRPDPEEVWICMKRSS